MNERIIMLSAMLVLFTIIVLLSYIEMNKCERKAFAVYDLKDFSGIILYPAETGLSNVVYIHKSSERPHYTSSFIKENYVTDHINEHVANTIIKPVNKMLYKLQSTRESYSPINTLYGAVTDASSLISVIALNNINKGDYVIEHDRRDKINGFTVDERLYIIL